MRADSYLYIRMKINRMTNNHHYEIYHVTLLFFLVQIRKGRKPIRNAILPKKNVTKGERKKVDVRFLFFSIVLLMI